MLVGHTLKIGYSILHQNAYSSEYDDEVGRVIMRLVQHCNIKGEGVRVENVA